MENDRVLVPLRAIMEALGATVAYDEASETVTAEKDGLSLALPIGGLRASVNGAEMALDAPARVINGRTLVPARFVAENLGANVDWDAANNAVVINGTELKKRNGN
jgi:hypothetical protein